MIYKIYRTVNVVNGKIYIGQTHADNANYFGSGNLITAALKKYGKANFVKDYIDEARTQEELDEKEKFWIKELKSQDKNVGYNIANGGWFCFTMNDDIKNKISKTLKGKYVGDMAFRKGISLSEEHKSAISKANKGKKLSEDTRKKLSEAHKGKKLSEDTRKKLSESHKGKILSDESKRKISEAGKGRLLSQDQKNQLRISNINKTQKHSRTISALCIKTNMEINFNNMSEASRYLNVSRHRVKNNLVDGWQLIVGEPIVSIKELKMTKNGSESRSNTG